MLKSVSYTHLDVYKRQVGYMLQRDNLLEWRTILDNVLFGLEIQQAKTPENVQRAVRGCV